MKLNTKHSLKNDLRHDLSHPGGLSLRILAPDDVGLIMELQDVMLSHLPDPSWYFSSPEDVFAGCCARGETYGYFDGDTLAGFAILTPGWIRGDKSYAVRIGESPENTYDFQDVMVRPEYRRRGIHSAFLRLFEKLSRRGGGRAMYCTIAPANKPSIMSFEKAGYRLVRTQKAYAGLMRGYYKKTLA